MKKLLFTLFTLLIIFTGCDINSSVADQCTITTVFDASKVTVTPYKTSVSKGGIAKLTFLNLPGYIVTEIQVNGNPVEVPNDGVLSVTANSDHVFVKFISIVAVYYYTLTSSCDQGIILTSSGEKKVPNGQSVDIEFVAKEGNFIESLVVDGTINNLEYATTKIIYKFIANDTLKHTLRGVSRKRGFATITSSSNANGTVASSGTFSVPESSQMIFTATENQFCGLKRWILDGMDVNPSHTYTFFATDTLAHTIKADFVKELEWYLMKITWIRDSLYVNNQRNYVPGSEVLNFSSNGTYIKEFNNKTSSPNWSLDKSTNPPTLKLDYGLCKVEVLNETKMVISVFNGSLNQNTTYIYHGVPR